MQQRDEPQKSLTDDMSIKQIEGIPQDKRRDYGRITLAPTTAAKLKSDTSANVIGPCSTD